MLCSYSLFVFIPLFPHLISLLIVSQSIAMKCSIFDSLFARFLFSHPCFIVVGSLCFFAASYSYFFFVAFKFKWPQHFMKFTIVIFTAINNWNYWSWFFNWAEPLYHIYYEQMHAHIYNAVHFQYICGFISALNVTSTCCTAVVVFYSAAILVVPSLLLFRSFSHYLFRLDTLAVCYIRTFGTQHGMQTIW